MVIHNKVLVGSLVAATSISAFALSSTIVKAESELPSATVSNVSVRIATSCTFSGSVTTAHTASTSAGTYLSGIELGETVITTVCNDPGGFGVYAIGFTGDQDGNNKLVHGTKSNIYINTGTATGGQTSAWAMKLVPVENASTPTILNDYDDYNVVPDDYVKVAEHPSVAAQATPSTFKTYYAAYVSPSQAAGTYTGKVKYVMVYPSSAAAPEKESSQEEDMYINPDPDISHDTSHSDGTVYPGNSLLRAFEVAYTKAGKPMYVKTNDTTNYPIGWKPMESGDTGEVRFAMQDIGMTFEDGGTTKNVCAWAQESRLDNSWIDEALVMDLRDGKSYWIAKLADSKCWMTQNLDYDITSGIELNSTTSDLKIINDQEGFYNSGTGYRQENNIIYWNPNRSTYTDIDDVLNSPTAQTSYSPGEWYWKNSPWYESEEEDIESSDKFRQNIPFESNGLHGHLGNYYNYTAAIATNTAPSAYYSHRLANSICPAGWQLPAVDAEDAGLNDYQTLFDTYSIPTGTEADDAPLVGAPFYLIRGGDVYYQYLEYAGAEGIYWNNGPDSSVAGGMFFNSGNGIVTANTWHMKYEAGSIRCISTFHATE